ncbi:MAG: cytochrome b [Gammaproteobacteria bacterium]|nr:cytochrome b [Gammaproteobacteria bacterium]
MNRFSTERYTAFARALHWLMALMILGLIAVGIYMSDLPDDAPNRLQIYTLHKTFGVLALFLIFVRIAWNLINKPPALPALLKPWEVKLTLLVKASLYLLMIATPMAGYALSNFADKSILLFGVFEMPVLFAPSEEGKDIAGELHEILAFTMLGLVALHVAGAIKHRLFDRPEADVLKRML